MTDESKFPGWVLKQAECNPSGFLAALISQPGAREKSRTALNRLEYWCVIDVLKAHALRMQKRVEELESALSEREWKGVWNSKTMFRKHNSTTYAGSLWVATEDSIGAKPGESAAWKLQVKRGAEPDPKKIANHMLPAVLKAIETR